jgi:hypothetical protein
MIFKIGLSGTHSTGKTGSCKELFDIFSSEFKKTILVEETARDCPYPLNREASPEAQKWVFAEQLKRDVDIDCKLALEDYKNSLEKHAVVIYDRSLIDNAVYTFIDSRKDTKTWSFASHLLNFAMEYENTDEWHHILFTPEDFKEAEPDGFRDVDREWRQKINDEFVKIWKFNQYSIGKYLYWKNFNFANDKRTAYNYFDFFMNSQKGSRARGFVNKR